jgi:hypothetical protein
MARWTLTASPQWPIGRRWMGHRGCDSARSSPSASPGADRRGRAQSRRRCGSSPGADVAGVSRVPVQMWQGEPSPGADVAAVSPTNERRHNFTASTQLRAPPSGRDAGGCCMQSGAPSRWGWSRRSMDRCTVCRIVASRRVASHARTHARRPRATPRGTSSAGVPCAEGSAGTEAPRGTQWSVVH